MDKEKQWNGYYAPYFSDAQKKGIRPVQLLDQLWFDGRTASACVLPFISKDSLVLEVACGIGRVSRFVAPYCGTLYCTDILDEALSEAKNNLAGCKNVRFKKTNGYDLDFAPGSFDCVYSFTAFFHFDFELVVNYFSEIRRVLKPGGVGIIEFKRWTDIRDVIQLLTKIKNRGGIQTYERDLDKWRYVSKETLALLCDFYKLETIDEDVTRYTFRKKRLDLSPEPG